MGTLWQLRHSAGFGRRDCGGGAQGLAILAAQTVGGRRGLLCQRHPGRRQRAPEPAPASTAAGRYSDPAARQQGELNAPMPRHFTIAGVFVAGVMLAGCSTASKLLDDVTGDNKEILPGKREA